jgi:hypothetical protein
VSGGLLEFLWNADHQTLGEMLDEAARRITSYLRQDCRKGAASMFDRVLECDSEAERNEQVGSREDAEEYDRQHSDTITDVLKAVLESPPTLEVFA